ncbi:hypothetical protein N8Z24_00080 [bacterium]|nr:hypothetical protein [bacterium]
METKAHHLWSAESGSDNNVTITRSTAEREDLEAAEAEFAKSAVDSAWGFFGAKLVDTSGFDRIEMPVAVKDRFNTVATQLKEARENPPKVHSWQDLEKVFGSETVKDIKFAVVHGMKVRRASKFLNIPFILTADLLEDVEVIGKSAVKDIVSRVKQGKALEAIREYGSPAEKVVDLFKEAHKTGSHKIAVDESAKKYWEDYYGEYGAQLVKETQKRIRADLAYEWLQKCGVDQAAAEYWQNYFSDSDYGKALTEVLPKKLTPSKKDKKED